MCFDQDLSNRTMNARIQHGFDAFRFGPFYVHLDDGNRLMETLQELHQVNHFNFKGFPVRVFMCLDQGRRFGPAEIADVRPLMECGLSRRSTNSLRNDCYPVVVAKPFRQNLAGNRVRLESNHPHPIGKDMSRDVANIGTEIDEQAIGGKLFHKLMEIVFGLPHAPWGPVPPAIRVPAQHEFEIAFPQHNHARQILVAPTRAEYCPARQARQLNSNFVSRV